MENYQTPDGVNVPEVLQPYMNGIKFIPYNQKKVKKWQEDIAKEKKRQDDKAADGGKKKKNKGGDAGETKKDEAKKDGGKEKQEKKQGGGDKQEKKQGGGDKAKQAKQPEQKEDQQIKEVPSDKKPPPQPAEAPALKPSKKLDEVEEKLKNSEFLGGAAPSLADKEAYDELKDTLIKAKTHPHTFAWICLVGSFSEPAR